MVPLTTLLSLTTTKLVNVHPILATRVLEHVALGFKNNLYFAAFCGERTWAEQAIEYAKGRTTPGPKVTNAQPGDSAHNYGLAVDQVEDGNITKVGMQWSWKSVKDYIKYGQLAKQCGLEWGGLWHSIHDFPHVSLTAGLTIPEAKVLYTEGGRQAVWDEVTKRIAQGIIGTGW